MWTSDVALYRDGEGHEMTVFYEDGPEGGVVQVTREVFEKLLAVNGFEPVPAREQRPEPPAPTWLEN